MRPWFVYTLHDPREPDVVRYVGWTVDPKRRLENHLADAHSKKKSRCNSWKLSVLRAGERPVLTVIESGSGDGWKAAEVRWIAHFRAAVGDRLTNLTAGGDGVRGYVATPETRAKLSAARQGRRMPAASVAKSAATRRGGTRSAESRAKMSASHKGKPLAPEHAKAAAAAHVGLRKSEASKARASESVRAYHARRRSAGKLSKRDELRSYLSIGVTDLGDLADAVYGSDTRTTRKRVSAQLATLRSASQ